MAAPEYFASRRRGRMMIMIIMMAVWCIAGTRSVMGGYSRKLMSLVQQAPLILPYHGGPLLDASLPVYIIWYGRFSESERASILDFFASFGADVDASPNVRSWWKVTEEYKDGSGSGVKQAGVHVGGSLLIDDAVKGKSLRIADLEYLVMQSLDSFPTNCKGIYLVLTSEDIYVDGFCGKACGSHFYSPPSKRSKGQQLPYAWVGNAASQCPGKCAWPFAKPTFFPESFQTLVPPSGSVGLDGMIMNIAMILAGTATDPYHNAFYQGDAAAPLEAATACAGVFGEGAYPGHPGDLLQEEGGSGSSFNVYGINDRKYLLPALWNPSTLACSPPSLAQMAMKKEEDHLVMVTD